MKLVPYSISALLLLLLGIAGGCTPSRGIIASGKVTPKGAFKIGANSSFNISTAPLAEIDDVTKAAVDAIADRDSIFYNENVRNLTRGLLAYSLDPVAPTSDFYVRYGVVTKVDIGYKYAAGAHVFDAMYQFMGGTGTPDNPGDPGMHGSVGLQYSGQKSNLPGKLGLDKLSSVFSYELSRKDLLIPLAFSKSFGPEEQYGNVSFGVVYGHTFIKYGFEPSKLFVKVAGQKATKVNPFLERNSFSSYGAFLNAKIGYKYAYFVPAISIYYQDYGTYNILGLHEEPYKGMTFIPSLGVQFNLGYTKAGNKR